MRYGSCLSKATFCIIQTLHSLFVTSIPTLKETPASECMICFAQEDDPLDAFMADLNNMDKQPEAPPVPIPDKKRKADVGLDEEADNVADFLEVHTHMLP